MGDRRSWRFLIDENLHPGIVTELERLGLRAEYVPDVLCPGANDFEDILPYCRETGNVLVTKNVRDFNETGLERDDHAGIVIVHDKDRPAAEIADEIQRIVEAYGETTARLGFESADDWTS